MMDGTHGLILGEQTCPLTIVEGQPPGSCWRLYPRGTGDLGMVWHPTAKPKPSDPADTSMRDFSASVSTARHFTGFGNGRRLAICTADKLQLALVDHICHLRADKPNLLTFTTPPSRLGTPRWHLIFTIPCPAVLGSG